MQRLIALLIAVLLIGGLAGCATFRGMGQDIENLGKGIKKSAS